MAKEQPVRLALVGVAVAAMVLAVAVVASTAHAGDPKQIHPPMFECASAGTLRVTCHGSFADGSSAAGIAVRVLDKTDHVVYVGVVDRNGRVSFRRPDAEFSVVFDAGRGNVLTLLGSDMT
jgi:hypothetical protein